MLQFVPELREFVAVFQGHELQHVPKPYYFVDDLLRKVAENFALHSLTIIRQMEKVEYYILQENAWQRRFKLSPPMKTRPWTLRSHRRRAIRTSPSRIW